MSLLVIIHNLYVPRVIFMPAKTNAVLIIDADAMLPVTISLQRFKVISRRTSEIVEGFCKINCTKPAGCNPGDAAIFPTATRRKNLTCFFVLKITDHTYSVSRTTFNARRNNYSNLTSGFLNEREKTLLCAVDANPPNTLSSRPKSAPADAVEGSAVRLHPQSTADSPTLLRSARNDIFVGNVATSTRESF